MGLKSIGCRLSDRVDYFRDQREENENRRQAFLKANGWEKPLLETEIAKAMMGLMERGMSREEAKDYCLLQQRIEGYIRKQREAGALTCTSLSAMMIAYGTK